MTDEEKFPFATFRKPASTFHGSISDGSRGHICLVLKIQKTELMHLNVCDFFISSKSN